MDLGVLLTYLATPLFLACIAAEVAWARRARRPVYELRVSLGDQALRAALADLMVRLLPATVPET